MHFVRQEVFAICSSGVMFEYHGDLISQKRIECSCANGATKSAPAKKKEKGERQMADDKKILTTAFGIPVGDDPNGGIKVKQAAE